MRWKYLEVDKRKNDGEEREYEVSSKFRGHFHCALSQNCIAPEIA